MQFKLLVDAPLTSPLLLAPVEPDPPCLDIAIDDRSGSIEVRDPRSFNSDRRPFCRRLIEAAVRQHGIGRAEIDLATATCRIQFEPGSPDARSMAEAFSRAVAEAAAKSRSSRTLPWWRSERPWLALTAYPSAGDVSLWETLESAPGRTKLRHSGVPKDRSRLTLLRDSLARLPGVDSCGANTWTHTLLVEYPSESPIPPCPFDTLELALRGTSDSSARLTGAPMSLARRLKYLTLAGGSFALTIAGLIIPGVPTVPFLLATSYYLARSSPALDARLRRTAFLGPILDEWEIHQALSPTSKAKLLGLTATIILVTVSLAPLSAPVLVLILLVSSVGVVGILRMPQIEPQARPTAQVLRVSLPR